MTIPKIKDVVGPDKKVYFISYKNKEFWYRAENGFEFPIPLSDTEGAEFLAEDRSMLFMRWINRRIKVLNEEKGENYG
jgi:hypothetical protein